MNKIKPIHIVLILILIIIWFKAIKDVFFFDNQDEQNEQVELSEITLDFLNDKNNEQHNFKYEQSKRNLFRNYKKSQPVTLNNRKVRKVINKNFSYPINGVLINKDLPIILVNKNNKTLFLNIGDTLDTFVLKQINSNNAVFMTYDSTEIVVKIGR